MKNYIYKHGRRIPGRILQEHQTDQMQQNEYHCFSTIINQHYTFPNRYDIPLHMQALVAYTGSQERLQQLTHQLVQQSTHSQRLLL